MLSFRVGIPNAASNQRDANDTYQPHISAHSRRLAERAHQALAFEERLGKSHAPKRSAPQGSCRTALDEVFAELRRRKDVF